MSEEIRARAEAHEIVAARALRIMVIVFCAGQMMFGWALPLTYGTSSNALLQLGFATGTRSLAMWTAALTIGHLMSLFARPLQRPFGFLHATTCCFIGYRLATLGFGWQCFLYVFVYSLPGLAIFVTAPGRKVGR